MAERTIKTADNGYKWTQKADVPTEQRVWGDVIDTAHLDQFHQVPIAEYEAWKVEIEKLNPLTEEFSV